MPKASAAPPPGPLYASRKQIYPQRVTGTFRRIKTQLLLVLLGIYYAVPWIRWDRGPGVPDQAILADMPGRRLYLLDLEIWPQEIFYLTGLLVLAAIGLFLVTAVAGRIWCGFFCPQTVWTDLFMMVERLIQGDRNRRIKRDAQPLSFDKIWRKVATHISWLFIAVATGGAWVWYFADAPTVTAEFFSGQASDVVYGCVLVLTSTTYMLGGLAREQVCTYMCPWPRFQGAMFDEHSLVITYEEWRGEPRAPVAKGGTRAAGAGDCVDCNLCVNVCPTGIDIRKGQQMECIGCALCVDACNLVMKRVGREGNLIAYDSIANMHARSHNLPTKVRAIRPRTIGYTVIMSLIAVGMMYGLATRANTEVNLQRDRAPLFVNLSDGGIRNGYTLKIINMVRAPRTFTLTIAGLDDSLITVVGIEKNGAKTVTLPVKSDKVGTFRVFVRTPARSLTQTAHDVTFVVTDVATGKTLRQPNFFYGPKQ